MIDPPLWLQAIWIDTLGTVLPDRVCYGLWWAIELGVLAGVLWVMA